MILVGPQVEPVVPNSPSGSTYGPCGSPKGSSGCPNNPRARRFLNDNPYGLGGPPLMPLILLVALMVLVVCFGPSGKHACLVVLIYI